MNLQLQERTEPGIQIWALSASNSASQPWLRTGSTWMSLNTIPAPGSHLKQLNVGLDIEVFFRFPSDSNVHPELRTMSERFKSRLREGTVWKEKKRRWHRTALFLGITKLYPLSTKLPECSVYSSTFSIIYA